MASSKINNDIEYEYLLEEEEIVASILQQEMMEANEEATSIVKRRRTIKDYFTSFWESAWGKLLLHPNVEIPTSVEGRRFRRRFRLPYPLFQYLVEICTRLNIFDLTNKSPIPIQLKILACLSTNQNRAKEDLLFKSWCTISWWKSSEIFYSTWRGVTLGLWWYLLGLHTVNYKKQSN